MDKPTARISIYVLPVIGILVVTSVDLANGMSCSNNSLAAALGRQTKQMDAGTATLNKLEGQFDKLCQYGRKSGTPLFERQIKELSDIVKTCQDMITRAVLFSNRVTFIGYKASVEADCKRADALSRTPQSVGDFLARGKAFRKRRVMIARLRTSAKPFVWILGQRPLFIIARAPFPTARRTLKPPSPTSSKPFVSIRNSEETTILPVARTTRSLAKASLLPTIP